MEKEQAQEMVQAHVLIQTNVLTLIRDVTNKMEADKEQNRVEEMEAAKPKATENIRMVQVHVLIQTNVQITKNRTISPRFFI